MIKKENVYCKIKIANESSKYFISIGRTIAGKIFPVIQAFDRLISEKLILKRLKTNFQLMKLV